MILKTIRDILHVLRDTHALLAEMRSLHARKKIPLEKRKLWTKQEVMDTLGMSDTTYKRHLRTGLLKPIRLGGTDLYFEEDILEAMEESRRKGKF